MAMVLPPNLSPINADGTYNMVGNSIGPGTGTITTGYYNPLSSACKSAKLTASELNWLNAEAKALNQTIKNVSSYYNFVEYVPVSFAGHDICSSKPWVQGLTAKAPFHPTATGQKVIGNAVVAALKN